MPNLPVFNGALRLIPAELPVQLKAPQVQLPASVSHLKFSVPAPKVTTVFPSCIPESISVKEDESFSKALRENICIDRNSGANITISPKFSPTEVRYDWDGAHYFVFEDKFDTYSFTDLCDDGDFERMQAIYDWKIELNKINKENIAKYKNHVPTDAEILEQKEYNSVLRSAENANRRFRELKPIGEIVLPTDKPNTDIYFYGAGW